MSINPANIPSFLKSLNRWLVWRLKQLPGEHKTRKIPYYVNGAARGGVDQGSEADLAQLTSFDKAVSVCERGNYSGVGFAVTPGCGVVAVDFDNVVTDGVVRDDVLKIIEGTYAEFSPSGTGVRAFFKGSVPSRKSNAIEKNGAAFEVEFFGTSGFVTVTGRALPDVEFFGLTDTVAPLSAAALALYRERFGSDAALIATGGSHSADDLLLLTLTPKVGLESDRVTELLSHLPPEMADNYEDWLKVGMAVHHETDGEGFDIWLEWSKKSPKFGGEEHTRKKWQSFGRNTGSNPITMAWVLKQVKDEKVTERYEALSAWRNQIKDSTDEFNLREKVCAQIATDKRLGDLEREALAQVLCDTLRSIGVKYPIAQCRKLVAEKRLKKPAGQEDQKVPQWLRGWVYVTENDKFFRVDSEEWLTQQGFNAKFTREIELDEKGRPEAMPHSVALDYYQIPVVTRGMYVPGAGALFTADGGTQCVNTYRPSSVPQAAQTITPEGRAAINLVVGHIEMICGARPEVIQTILSWIAHNVRKPGVKIRWAPLIKGIEGDGKTIIGSLTAALMGRLNVRNVTPKVLYTDFTGWALGACVAVLEEIKLAGHNRHDVFNTLKPFIANDAVEVHPKGKDPFDIMNTQNYIAFTNHEDALPIEDTDRRWLVVFTPFKSTADMESAIERKFGSILRERAGGAEQGGGSPFVRGWSGAYFDLLHAAISSHVAELRKFFLDYPIPDWFNPNGRALSTDEKRQMVALNSGSDDEAIRYVIEQGAEGVGPRALSSSMLTKALVMADVPDVPRTSAMNRLLSRLGYKMWTGGLVKWRGAPHRCWVRDQSIKTNEELRSALDETGVSVDDLFAANGGQSDDLFGSINSIDALFG